MVVHLQKWQVGYKQHKTINDAGYPQVTEQFFVQTEAGEKVLMVSLESVPQIYRRATEIAVVQHLVEIHNKSLEPPKAVTPLAPVAEISGEPQSSIALAPVKKKKKWNGAGGLTAWRGVPYLKEPDGSRMKLEKIKAFMVVHPILEGMKVADAQAFYDREQQDRKAVENSGMGKEDGQEAKAPENSQPDGQSSSGYEVSVQEQTDPVKEDVQQAPTSSEGLYR